MTIARLHEAYIADDGSPFAARFATVSGGIAEPHRLSRGARTLVYDLHGGQPRVLTLSQLPAALGLTVSWGQYGQLYETVGSAGDWHAALDAVTRLADVYRFGEYLSYAETVPFEASPLQLRALASIATASPMGIGATLAFMVFGTSPLVLVAVPVGMIVVGAAAGVSQALEEGLRARMLSFLTPRTQHDIEIEEALIEAQIASDVREKAPEKLMNEQPAAHASLVDEQFAAERQDAQQSDVTGAHEETEQQEWGEEGHQTAQHGST